MLTAELIAEAGDLSRFRSADALAAAAGIAPSPASPARCVSSDAPRAATTASNGSSPSPASARSASPDSRAFYARKRREGKRHHQAVIALARRRVNVLWAILQTRSPFQANFKIAA
nr:transposase [Rhizobium mesoamericanum]